MGLQVYQKEIDDWAQGLALPYWSALSILARVTEEVGEVARIVNHLYGDKPKKPSEDPQDLGEEIADVMFALICLANREKIDLDAAMRKAIDKSYTRDKDRFEKKNPAV